MEAELVQWQYEAHLRHSRNSYPPNRREEQKQPGDGWANVRAWLFFLEAIIIIVAICQRFDFDISDHGHVNAPMILSARLEDLPQAERELRAFCVELQRRYQTGSAKGSQFDQEEYWQFMRFKMEGERRFQVLINEPYIDLLVAQLYENARQGTIPSLSPHHKNAVSLEEIRTLQEEIATIYYKPTDWAGGFRTCFSILSAVYIIMLGFRLILIPLGFIERRREIKLGEEIRLEPWRLLLAIFVFYPGYPRFSTPAHYSRFLRLQARYLGHKPLFYRLTAAEEEYLRQRAHEPAIDFEAVALSLAGVSSSVAKRSLAWAYASMLLVALVRPLFVLVEPVQSVRLVTVLLVGEQIITLTPNAETGQHLESRAPPGALDWASHTPVVLPRAIELFVLLKVRQVWLEAKITRERVIREIEHVPRLAA